MNQPRLSTLMTTECLKTSDDCYPELAVPSSNASHAALDYVLAHPEHAPMQFLQLWCDRQFDALRLGWEDVPDAVFAQYSCTEAC